MARHKGQTPLNANSLLLYAYIEQVHSLEGHGPTYGEMIRNTGIKSKAAVQYHLLQLEDMGWITRQPKIDRGIVPIHYPRIHYRHRSTED